MYQGSKVVVIAPCYNEAAKIGLVVQRVRAVEFVLGRLGLEQQNVAEHLMPQKVVTLLKRG